MRNRIGFNKPYLTGKETEYIKLAVESGKISGNGIFTKQCQEFFEKKYGFSKCLLTTSCTDAIEMAAILANIQPGDEVIMPSFTFVSTALAFIRQGAKIIFADSYNNNPNIDANALEPLITHKTKAIVPVHYAGISCAMEEIMDLAAKYNLIVIEDAAQAIDSYYIGKNGEKKALGSISHMATFSFHETKNIISGEGGMLTINDNKFIERAEIIWEKGTNRSKFFRGEIDKYSWIDIGSSFLPSEIVAAFLWAQIENLDKIQEKRIKIWDKYYNNLKDLTEHLTISLPVIPQYSTNNGHIFYINCLNLSHRTKLIKYLKSNEINAVFHYQSLHSSPYYYKNHDGRILTNSDKFSDCLLRLPLYYELSIQEVDYITKSIIKFI
jgi:dTDP-4-amino-4,6-dideoxygalactose transaminase